MNIGTESKISSRYIEIKFNPEYYNQIKFNAICNGDCI